LKSADPTEADAAIADLGTTAYHSEIVDRGISKMLDVREPERALLIQLFRDLSQREILTTDHFSKGIAGVLEYGDDIVIDFPLAFTQLADLIGSLIFDDALPMSYLGSEYANPIKDSGNLVKLADLTFVKLKELAGDEADEKLTELVRDSKLVLKDLVRNDGELEKLLEKHQALKNL
jgi:hypothetical protein